MAKRRIETSIEIEAPPKKVWSLLIDFAEMPTWNPFIKSISGKLAPGSKLSVYIVPPGRSGMRFRPIVLAVEPERELRWLGRLLLPGILDGEHYFLLEPVGSERTRLMHGENFSGVLVGALGKTLPATRNGYEIMNVALKQRAEVR